MFYQNGFTRGNPFQQLRREMEELFGNYLRGGTIGSSGYPAVNVFDEGDTLAVEAEVPGVKMSDLEILAVGNELIIKGRRTPVAGQNVAFHRQERGTGDFSRVVTLPVDVNAERIEAVLRDGVLTIRLPKAETAKPRKITVKSV